MESNLISEKHSITLMLDMCPFAIHSYALHYPDQQFEKEVLDLSRSQLASQNTPKLFVRGFRCHAVTPLPFSP